MTTPILSINNENYIHSQIDRSTPSNSEASSCHEETISLNQSLPEGLYSSVVNSGHANVESNESFDDDDQFYDTCSNDESESESENFKLLEKSTIENIDDMRKLFHESTSNNINQTVATIILLGTKFKSINTFLNLLTVIEEVVLSQGSELFANFKALLEVNVLNWFDLMVSQRIRFYRINSLKLNLSDLL